MEAVDKALGHKRNRRLHAIKHLIVGVIYLALMIWSLFSVYRLLAFLAVVALLATVPFYIHRRIVRTKIARDKFLLVKFTRPSAFVSSSFSWPWWRERYSYCGVISSDTGETVDCYLSVEGAVCGLIRQRVDCFVSVGCDCSNEEMANRLTMLSRLTTLTRLDLCDSKITDAGLKDLQAFVNLESLALNNTNVVGFGLELLKPLRNLRSIELSESAVCDSGLEHLRMLASLNHLYLRDTQISDQGLAHLRTMTVLESIYLDGAQSTEKGRQAIRAALPNCLVAPNP